jgi:prepilin-type N-terminal cleavage/methylation domain-containing protein
MRRRQAFTLVELLVVISIISVLSSLILPTLSGAREKARRVACINNLRQFGNALQMYSQDYNGRFPVTQRAGPQPSALACLGLLYERYLSDNEVFVCMSDGIDPPEINLPTDYDAPTPAVIPPEQCSYGFDPDHWPVHPDGVALVADLWGDGTDPSQNHHGEGQNVLFVGHHVKWCPFATCGVDGDDIFSRGAGGRGDSWIRK